MTRFSLSMQATASRRREQSMGTPWCREFRQKIFDKFPLVANDLVRGVVAVDAASGGGSRGNVKANTWLRAMEQQLSLGPFNTTWDDQALEDYALVKAERVAAELGRLGREADAALAQTRRRYCWQAPRPSGIRLAGLVYRPHTWPCRRDAELEALREALGSVQLTNTPQCPARRPKSSVWRILSCISAKRCLGLAWPLWASSASETS